MILLTPNQQCQSTEGNYLLTAARELLVYCSSFGIMMSYATSPYRIYLCGTTYGYIAAYRMWGSRWWHSWLLSQFSMLKPNKPRTSYLIITNKLHWQTLSTVVKLWSLDIAAFSRNVLLMWNVTWTHRHINTHSTSDTRLSRTYIYQPLNCCSSQTQRTNSPGEVIDILHPTSTRHLRQFLKVTHWQFSGLNL